MDLQKAKITLDKINALYRNMSTDARNISSIEKDLMRSYIQQLYEVFLELPEAAPAPAPPVEIIKSTPRATFQKPEPPQPPPAPTHEREEDKPLPAAIKMPEPEARVETEPAPPPPPPKPTPVQQPEPAPAPVHAQPIAPPVTADGELEELFTIALAKELSEKLGELPITDIKKAMGLNERIFTVNELFGGDQAVFDETLSSLNRLPGFEEAKKYLINGVATRYNWSSKDKKSKARNFIKLVKRRYN
ncbi:MAG: hypothetical protein H6577_01855 [Lewinellaceae bacterium]|nr:hypothetical protein [Saprospiraceae bacterium]MCB9336852.1 hypothetical protein [Lewinellaceae bacterium]